MDSSSKQCTSLDHIYPSSKFGTSCYCGARVRGGSSKKGASKKPASFGGGSEASFRGQSELANTEEKTSLETQKGMDSSATLVVDSTQIEQRSVEAVGQPAATNNQPAPAVTNPRVWPATGDKTMTLTLKGLSKNGKQAFYSGSAQVVRVQVANFAGGTAPQSFEVPDGVFAAPKAKLTAEERKAQKAAKPKLTLAEKIAKREEALARLKAKAAAPQADANQPSL
jgi:hypothetical protein